MDHEESFSNGLIRQPLLWLSRRFLQRARSKASADCAPLRPTRSRPKIGRDYNKQARKCKLPCSGAMADLEESFSNDHIRHLLLWKSRRGFWRARLKVLMAFTPIKYLRKESLPSPTSQICLLHLLVWEGARRPRKLLLPGNWRRKTSPPPGQKRRG